jgi:putative transposase
MSSGVYNKYSGYHNRRSIRLRGYDYSQPGVYFITVCIHDRKQKLFGDVVGGIMNANDCGHAVRHCWNDLLSHYPHIQLDEFAIMPNHVHGIIIIREYASHGSAFRDSVIKPRNKSPQYGKRGWKKYGNEIITTISSATPSPNILSVNISGTIRPIGQPVPKII